ncbi:hypothetical protein [Tunicatimonas pelagia]|uniref:hypothetical protein n=1 Tax=Tunicatimonas pelagia TaxID=931531 RepID=UPI002666B5A9|nr:hypothetical protein [Tunicatimonas pelagia]WKN46533.1 hypothetical protein P0M28_30965 [Tunicatimonas pelagia]
MKRAIKKEPYPIFAKSLVGAVVIIGLGLNIYFQGTRTKEEVPNIQGTIIYLSNTFEELPKRHLGKYKYLGIDTYPQVFELFIGKDEGDIKPEFEKFSELKIGDNINIYFDESPSNADPRINRQVEYIDRNGQLYFILGGDMDRIGGLSFVGLGILLIVVLFILKKTGKIA